MSSLKRAFKKFQHQYVDLWYQLRHTLKWKRLNTVYLRIDDPQLSRKIVESIVRGDYEIDENNVLERTFTPDDILLELGTGIGFNAIYRAKINGGKVFTYEGNPGMISLIQQNMQKNGTSFSVKNEIVVVGADAPTAVRFNIAENFWSSSSKQIGETIIKQVEVPTAALADILRQHAPTYLVMDIEGGEAELLQDCSWLAHSTIRKVMVELHANIIGEDTCFALMKNIVSAGFKMEFDGTPKNVVYFFR